MPSRHFISVSFKFTFVTYRCEKDRFTSIPSHFVDLKSSVFHRLPGFLEFLEFLVVEDTSESSSNDSIIPYRFRLPTEVFKFTDHRLPSVVLIIAEKDKCLPFPTSLFSQIGKSYTTYRQVPRPLEVVPSENRYEPPMVIWAGVVLSWLAGVACVDRSVRLSVLAPNSTNPTQNRGQNLLQIRPVVEYAVQAINSSGLLPGHSLHLEFRDTNCSSTYGPIHAFNLHNVTDVFIGPICEYVIAPVARYAAVWKLPVVTASGFADHFIHREEYATLTRVSGNYRLIAKCMAATLQHFNWFDSALMYFDYGQKSSLGHSDCYFALGSVFQQLTSRSSHRSRSQSFNETTGYDRFKEILLELTEKSRKVDEERVADAERKAEGGQVVDVREEVEPVGERAEGVGGKVGADAGKAVDAKGRVEVSGGRAVGVERKAGAGEGRAVVAEVEVGGGPVGEERAVAAEVEVGGGPVGEERAVAAEVEVGGGPVGEERAVAAEAKVDEDQADEGRAVVAEAKVDGDQADEG
ncbi:hypothetical protein GE061_007026 [Apolygus lucorum]|uniref:Receptor ligand binding region domain-containing protein n=1 Tax=Apolygus lucorum TaxID=248454 RepID=A0A8S9WQT0_APOLU|nr:hypothetical protein GE061_007026 [Apolygus lucorum]